ncbi:MAG: glycosyltransferase family 2 protein [Chloroflexi bacterium]|nr:glycosyltransferase family 2 protein [Chloroflexota bacterium]
MSHPYISLIMPIRNESAFIERGLLAIHNQDYPADRMEILIADGMSTDGSCDIINEFAARHPQLAIHIIDNPGKIVPTGINIAIRQVKGDIIVRVDGHCIIAEDYVRNCVEHLQNDGVDGVGGSMESVGETQRARAIAICVSSPFGVGNSAFRTISGTTKLVDTVPFPAYSSKIVKQAGFYDEELVRNQDDEYNYRIREMGGKILLADDVRSTYFSRYSYKGLWRQYYQYGYWKVRVMQKHPRQMLPRQFIPPTFVGSLLLTAFSAFITPQGLYALGLIVGAYTLVNLFFSIKAAKRNGWKYFPLLLIVYSILHFSYGTGFLVGLVRFANRWGDKIGKVPQWEETFG